MEKPPLQLLEAPNDGAAASDVARMDLKVLLLGPVDLVVCL